MRLLLISARPDTASNRRLAEAAADAGRTLSVADGTALVAGSDGALLAADPSADWSADAVLARVGNWRPDSLLALLEAVTGRGVATPNPAPAIRLGRDHWRTARTLGAAGIPVPLTLAGADPEALATTARRRLSLPVVVKQRRSRMGVGVIRCDSFDHLEAVLDSLWRLGDELVAQQYHETAGASLRLLVVGGDVVAAARMTARGGDWRSNAARGGEVAAIDPDPEAVRLAVAAARTAGLGICGVDLLPTADGPLVGEINPTPGFVHLERATGVDVARAVVDHLVTVGRG